MKAIGLIILLFNYCTFLLCYYYIYAEKEKLSGLARKHTYIHIYTCK